MAATTLRDIMTGLEARLETITGLRVSEFIPGQVNPPAAVVGVPPVPQYHSTMGAAGTYTVEATITLFVSAAYERGGQLALADYASPTGALSIPAAVLADKTLGGRVHDAHVTAFRPLGFEEVGVLKYYGGLFSVRIVAVRG